jgi:hypothetical protein
MRHPLFPAWIACLALAATTASADELPDITHMPANPDLRDPLEMLDGRRITTAEQWSTLRRPELKRLFQHYMYGFLPPAPAAIRVEVEREDPQFFGDKATRKDLAIAFGPPEYPAIHLLLVIPNAPKEPVPVFLGLNFYGNHTVLKDPTIRLPTVWVPNTKDHKASEAGRGSQSDVWAIEDSIDRGYAVATFYSGDIAPDHPGFTDGIIPLYWKSGQIKPGPNDWGTIAAWAWGLSRAVDQLRTEPRIDRGRIAAVGHSRMGKATLVAGAFDERIALVIPHQAGCGGSAPNRGTVGESVKRINTSFPHWFDDEFKTFNDQPARLPFDQHELVALCAPRPVLLTNASQDTWANPEGQFQVLKGADPVYRLLGAGGLDARSMPEPDRLIESTLGYHIRPGKHSMGKEDWKVFWAFADKHLGGSSGTRPAGK